MEGRSKADETGSVEADGCGKDGIECCPVGSAVEKYFKEDSES